MQGQSSLPSPRGQGSEGTRNVTAELPSRYRNFTLDEVLAHPRLPSYLRATVLELQASAQGQHSLDYSSAGDALRNHQVCGMLLLLACLVGQRIAPVYVQS